MKMADINAGATNLLSSVNRLVTDPDITNALASSGRRLTNTVNWAQRSPARLTRSPMV